MRTKEEIDKDYSLYSMRLGDVEYRKLCLDAERSHIVEKLIAINKEAKELSTESVAKVPEVVLPAEETQLNGVA